ncbi:DNA mismatch repair protein MutS [compost metagenome]
MAVKESDGQVTFLRKLIPGAASTSYGIYCARIAGLPGSIIDRAYQLLGAFEERAGAVEAAVSLERPSEPLPPPVPVVHAAAAPEEAVPAVQLSLFGLEEDKPSAADKAKRKQDARSEGVLASIREMDLMNMTPMMAMNLLYDLKRKLDSK